MKSNIRLNFGKKLKLFRHKRKLTQEQLANAAGIDYKYLQKIEGKNPPNIKIETIERFARALKVRPSELL